MKKILEIILILLFVNITFNQVWAESKITVNSNEYLTKNIINIKNEKFFSSFTRAIVISWNKSSQFLWFNCSKNYNWCRFYLKKTYSYTYNNLLNSEEWVVKLFFENKEVWEFKYIFNKNLLFWNKLDITEKLFKKSIQKYALSCEIAVSSDILSTVLKKDISEEYLVENVSKSFFWEKSEKWWIWWDPNEWFVWNIHYYNWEKAKQSNYTGYWVYEYPLYKIYRNLWFNAKIINKTHYKYNYNKKNHLTDLLLELKDNNFVQLWWDYCTNPGKEDGIVKEMSQKKANEWKNWINSCSNWNEDRTLFWYTKNEKNWSMEFRWLVWEHAMNLLGYIWDINNPSYIIIWDPKSGKHTYSIEEFYRKWDLMENRSLIIYSK